MRGRGKSEWVFQTDASTTSNAQTMLYGWWLVGIQKQLQSAVPVTTAVDANTLSEKLCIWWMILFTLSFNSVPNSHLYEFSFTRSSLSQLPHAAQHFCECPFPSHNTRIMRSKPGSILLKNIPSMQGLIRIGAMLSIYFLPKYKIRPHCAGPDMHGTEFCPLLKDFSLACCLALQSCVSSLDFPSLCIQSLSSFCCLPWLWHVCQLSRPVEKCPPLSLSVTRAQNQNHLKTSLLYVLGNTCSHWDISQLVCLCELLPAVVMWLMSRKSWTEEGNREQRNNLRKGSA